MTETFTVGVLTHNAIANLRWHLLERTLASIRVAFPQADVVVLDNGSTDGTGAALRGVDNPPAIVRYHDEDGNCGPARGRNNLVRFYKSIRKAGIWVFSDDDMAWRPNAESLLGELWSDAPDTLALVSGLLEPEYPWSKKLGACWCGNDPVMKVETRSTVPAAAWCLPANHWDFVGPFPEDGALGEDVQVCQRLVAGGYILGQVDLAEHIGQGYSLCGNDEARQRLGASR